MECYARRLSARINGDYAARERVLNEIMSSALMMRRVDVPPSMLSIVIGNHQHCSQSGMLGERKPITPDIWRIEKPTSATCSK